MSGIPADRMARAGRSLASPKRGQTLHPSPDDPVVFPGLTIASMNELLPGRNPALDVVCDGILTGRQIVLPPAVTPLPCAP